MSFLLIKMSASQKGLKTGKNGDIRPQGSGRAKGPARSRLFVPSAAAGPLKLIDRGVKSGYYTVDCFAPI